MNLHNTQNTGKSFQFLALKDLTSTHFPFSPVTILSVFTVQWPFCSTSRTHSRQPPSRQNNLVTGNSSTCASNTLWLPPAVKIRALEALPIWPCLPLAIPDTCHSGNASFLSGISTLRAFALAGSSSGAVSSTFSMLSPSLTPSYLNRLLFHLPPSFSGFATTCNCLSILYTDLFIFLPKMVAPHKHRLCLVLYLIIRPGHRTWYWVRAQKISVEWMNE